MATIGQWRSGTVGSEPPTTSWAAPSGFFATEDRNDGSAYSFSSSTATLTLPSSDLADGYLILAGVEFESSSATRYSVTTKIVQASGTSDDFVGTPTGRYVRDTNHDRAIIQSWAFVAAPSASSTFQFQWRSDYGSIPSTDGVLWSIFTVIPLTFTDYAAYTTTTAENYGGNTANKVTGFSGTSGTNITISNDTVTLAGDNKRYLCLGAQFDVGRFVGGRTIRWGSWEVDGVQEYAARGMRYYRDNLSSYNGSAFTWLIETATANVAVEQLCYLGDGIGVGEGGCIYDRQTPSALEFSMVFIELPDTAEVCLYTGPSTTEQDVAATGTVDLNVCETEVIADAGSFAKDGNNDVEVQTADDYLFGFNVGIASENVTTNSRFMGRGELTINGTEDTETGSGGYVRGYPDSDQGAFGASFNSMALVEPSALDLIGVSSTELATAEAVDAFEIRVQLDWASLWGINLDTLSGATPAGMQAEPGKWCWSAGNFALTGPGLAAASTRTYTMAAESAEWAWQPGNVSLDLTVTGAGGTERLFPNAIVSSTGYSGTPAAGDLDDDPDSPDGVWWTTTSNTSTTAELDMTAVTLGDADTAANALEVRVWVRNTGESTAPTADLYIYRGATLHATISTGTSITSSTGQLLSGTFTRGAFDATLSDLRVRIDGTPGGGPPGNRASVEVGAIEVNADYTGAAATTESFVLAADPTRWRWSGGGAPITYTPTSPQVTHHAIVAGGCPGWTFTGANASFRYSPRLIAASASWAWTGAAALLDYSRVLPAGSGAYAWVGADATLTYDAGTTTTLIADSAAYAWTGSAAVLTDNRLVVAGSGAYAWVGGAAVLARSYRLTAESASYAWTGGAAILAQSYRLTADSGAYAWTGGAAVLAQSRLLAAQAGAYAWAGADAVLGLTTLLTAESGAWAWTGSAALLAYSPRLNAASDAYAWTGSAAVLARSRTLTAESGAWAWTGTGAVLAQSRVLAAQAAAYTWAGSSAVLARSVRLTAASAAYAWTGSAAVLAQSRVLAAESGAYAWTGADAALDLAGTTTLIAASAAYAWAGSAAVLARSYRLTAASGAYAWTGTAAALVRVFTITAASGAYTWTGGAAGLAYSPKLIAGSAAYAWVGGDAVLDYNTITRLTAESAAYAWTGTAAVLAQSRLLAAQAGAYAWVGADAALNYGSTTTLLAESSAYTWTGAAAVLAQSRRAASDAGAYAWTGTAAALTRSLRTIAASGAYVWTGADAALNYGSTVTLVAESAAFAWSGGAAGLTYNRALVANSDAYDWTGTAAGVLYSRGLVAGSSAYDWTGTAATLTVTAAFVVSARNRVPAAHRTRYVHATAHRTSRPASHLDTTTKANT